MFRLLKTLLILAVFAPFASQAELFKGTASFVQNGTSTAPITVLVYSGRVQGTILSTDYGRIAVRCKVGKRGAFRGKVTGGTGVKGLITGSYGNGFINGYGTVTIPGKGAMSIRFSGRHASQPLTLLTGQYELDGSGAELTRATLTLFEGSSVNASFEQYSYLLRLYKNNKRLTEIIGFFSVRVREDAPVVLTTDPGFTDYRLRFEFSRPAGVHAPRLELIITDKGAKPIGEFSGRRVAE